MTDSNIVQFSATPGLLELMRIIDELRHRIHSGQTIALAIVEHRECGTVNVEICQPAVSFHHLTSGAVQLTHMLAAAAMQQQDNAA